jgi:hypothetical protein
MGKLDNVEKGVLVGTVWAAAFLSGLVLTRNGLQSFGNSLWFIILGFAAVGTINKHRQNLAKSNQPTTGRQ